MALVLWVVDGFQEFGIAPGAANVFRWATSYSVDHARICNAGYGIGDAQEFDRMLPAVAEVIEILQRFDADIFKNIGQARLAGIERSVAPIRIGHAPSYLPGADLIEMTIGPSHGGLENQVQMIESNCQRYLDPAPDHRFDVVERDLEMGNGVGDHAARLRRSIARAQFQGSSSSSLDAG